MRHKGDAMEISASLVKELRGKTGVGMMECKSALSEAKGDLSEAEKILRKKGLAAAANKAGRATGEGVIAARVDASGSTAVLVETNCETDFCARGADFQALVALALDTALARGSATAGTFRSPTSSPSSLCLRLWAGSRTQVISNGRTRRSHCPLTD